METTKPKTRMSLVLALNALYMIAESLCAAFVGVYFYVNSFDLKTVCHHYIAVYAMTALIFVLAGWVAKRTDRLHVYRLGLVLQALYYGLLLYLGPQAAQYPIVMGCLLGLAWGFFWQGNNVFAFDVATSGNRDYFFGLLGIVFNTARLVSPLVAGLIIAQAPGHFGYRIVFALSVVFYCIALGLSYGVPSDAGRRPFRFWRAMFPDSRHRDWRLMLWSAFSLAGAFNILPILLALLMYKATENEMSVGGFAGAQALCAILISWWLGRWLTPQRRRFAMRLGVFILCAAGTLVLVALNAWTLTIFGVLFALAMQLFSIPYMAIAYDVMWQDLETPDDRIEYLSAWEVPLGIGRVLMLGLLIGLAYLFPDDALGLRILLFILCVSRIASYWIVMQTDVMRALHPQHGTVANGTPASRLS